MVKVIFNWPYGGNDVLLYGSFTNWNACYKLDNSRSIELDLDPGVYEYKFMIDNEWMYDMAKPHITNNFLSRNNIIRVNENDGIDIVSIGDLCGKWEDIVLPEADVLIVTGNIVGGFAGTICEQLEKFNKWLGNIKIPYKLAVIGSKDLELKSKTDPIKKVSTLLYNCKVLNGDTYEIGRFKFFGIEHKFKNWAGITMNAYNDVWSSIPKDLDVLVTNTPPYDILDDYYGYPQGSEMLREKLAETTPTLHFFSTTSSCKEETITKTWKTGRQTLFVNSKVSNDNQKIEKNGILVHLS